MRHLLLSFVAVVAAIAALGMTLDPAIAKKKEADQCRHAKQNYEIGETLCFAKPGKATGHIHECVTKKKNARKARWVKTKERCDSPLVGPDESDSGSEDDSLSDGDYGDDEDM